MKTKRSPFTMTLAIGVIFLLLSACGSGPKTAEEPAAPPASVKGVIATVDRYGNIATDLSVDTLTQAGFELGDIVRLEAGTFNGEVPLVTTYADVQRGDALVRLNANGGVDLAINYGNFAQTNEAEVDMPVTITLVNKGGYKTELEIRNLTRTNNRADYASDAVFANFRDAKAGGIPANVLFRSCQPALGDERAPYAARLAEQARITTVINLSDTPAELATRAAAVPWYQTFVTRNNIVALGMGVDYKAPDFAAKLKTGLEFMLAHNAPYLVHCNEGKDRAGITVALLQALMGASPDDIVADYMISYANYYGVAKGEAR